MPAQPGSRGSVDGGSGQVVSTLSRAGQPVVETGNVLRRSSNVLGCVHAVAYGSYFGHRDPIPGSESPLESDPTRPSINRLDVSLLVTGASAMVKQRAD